MIDMQSPPYSLFLSLLKSELWQTPLELSLTHTEFLSVYELASKQTMLGVIADSLIRNNVHLERDKDNLLKVMSALERTWGVHTEGKPTEQHYDLVHNSIILELHHCLMRFASVKSQKIWNEIFQSLTPTYVEVDGCSVPTLEPTLNVLYTFLHLYHHLIELGVGLRQFSDVAILLKTHHDVIDKKQLYDWLDALDFRKAFEAVQLILVKVLGMDEKYVLSPLSFDRESLQAMNQFMDVVWFGGNFGFHGHNRSFRFKAQYFLVTTYRKLQLYYRFYRFSPREIKASVFSSIPRKALLALKGDLNGIT